MLTNRLFREQIARLVGEFIDAGRICDVDLLCSEFLSTKALPGGDDEDFFLFCADTFVRRTARDVVGKLNPKETSSKQFVLDGFEHLQKAYPVARDGRRLIVPLHLMTDEEIDDRAWELDAMAAGCTGHANEMREYKRRRGSLAAG